MVRMIDIESKPSVSRVARASSFIRLKPETLQIIKVGEVPKGDVLVVAQTAAILAVKRTPELIPLTYQITITSTDVIFKLEKQGIHVEVEIKSTGQSGAEMDTLVGVASALLTIWDMVKSLEKDEAIQYPTTSIEDIRVLKKVKG
jgi:cyclic pyranopterin phosphate synthase